MLKTTELRADKVSPWRRLGVIRLGVKVKTTKNDKEIEYPKDVEYFVIPEIYRGKLGEKPQELNIVLMNSTLAQTFDTRAALYRGNGSKACFTTDGVTAFRFAKSGQIDPITKKEVFDWMPQACPGFNCEFRRDKKCPEKGYFQFGIPASGEVGVFVLKIGSSVGIVNILASLRAVEEMTKGRRSGLQGIRMILRRVPTDFYRDIKGDGQLAKITKYIVTLDLDWNQLLSDDVRLLGPYVGKTLALPSAPAAAVIQAEDLHDPEEDPDDDVPSIPWPEDKPAAK